MPEVTSPRPPGTPCWIDLVTPDQQAAIDFYAELFGWSGAPGPPETGGYAVCELRGLPVAGIMSSRAPTGADDEPAAPTMWTTYLSSTDADATAEAIRGSGGTVHSPVIDVLDLGRMLVATDPAGAVFGVWEARRFTGSGVVGEPGAPVWHELNTTDPRTAADFYRSALGVEARPMEGAEDYYHALAVDGRTVGGMQALPASAPPEAVSHWLTYFAVADADAAIARLTAAGGTVLQPPFDMVAGRMALVTDAQGAPFAMITPTPTGDAAS
ncbi:VOC family protein [Streptomyces sp. NPDC018031]|uniref:VOC family protein n=1 Tax=Streptomyces sp. NPDC018031 TaxID=3365033 RepID=UPI0037B55F0A